MTKTYGVSDLAEISYIFLVYLNNTIVVQPMSTSPIAMSP